MYIVWVSTLRGRVGAFYEIYKDVQMVRMVTMQ